MEQAGYSYNPKTETPEQGKRRCAEALATAEEWAFSQSWAYRWRADWQVDHQKEFDCYEDGGPETCEYCLLVDTEGKVLQSMGCIDDASQAYRRVIEAELALEAMA